MDVYDAYDKNETIKEKYKSMRFNPVRISIAAARGILKNIPSLRADANKAFSLQIARLVLRFENPGVWQVLRQCDPNEEFLKRNIQGMKEILGLIEVPEA